jgi:hypothetical protein
MGVAFAFVYILSGLDRKLVLFRSAQSSLVRGLSPALLGNFATVTDMSVSTLYNIGAFACAHLVVRLVVERTNRVLQRTR